MSRALVTALAAIGHPAQPRQQQQQQQEGAQAQAAGEQQQAAEADKGKGLAQPMEEDKGKEKAKATHLNLAFAADEHVRTPAELLDRKQAMLRELREHLEGGFWSWDDGNVGRTCHECVKRGWTARPAAANAAVTVTPQLPWRLPRSRPQAAPS